MSKANGDRVRDTICPTVATYRTEYRRCSNPAFDRRMTPHWDAVQSAMMYGGTTSRRATLREVNVPVGGVEKVSPGCVALIREPGRHHRISSWFPRAANQPDVGLGGRSSTFSDVTLAACANDIVPTGRTPSGSRHDMIQAQKGRTESMAAILARMIVAGEHAAAIELDFSLGNSAKTKHADDSGHRHVVANRANPIVPVGSELSFDDTEFRPIVVIVRDVLPLLPAHHFHKRLSCMVSFEEESERPPRTDHA